MPSSSASRNRIATPPSDSSKNKKASKAKPAKQLEERGISQASQEKIIAAQKKRWAELMEKAAKDIPSSTSSKRTAVPASDRPKKVKVSRPKSDKEIKSSLSPKAIRQIAETQKKSWAALKKATKH